MQDIVLSPTQRQFIGGRLKTGSSLALALLGKQIGQFSNCSIDTDSPVSVTDNFEHGRLSGSRKSELVLQEVVSHFLSKHPAGMCLLEDQLAKPIDACIEPYKDRIVTFDEEVYHWFRGSDLVGNPDGVAEFLSRSGWINSFVGFLINVSLSSNLLSQEDIEHLANNTEVLMVGVFDSENVLFLSKEPMSDH